MLTTGRNGDNCLIQYIDILSGTIQSISGKYLKLVAGQIDMFAVVKQASNGVSGTPVLVQNKIVGMVSAVSSEYTNMTLCVPSFTITSLLNAWVAHKIHNLDNLHIFMGSFVTMIDQH